MELPTRLLLVGETLSTLAKAIAAHSAEVGLSLRVREVPTADPRQWESQGSFDGIIVLESRSLEPDIEKGLAEVESSHPDASVVLVAAMGSPPSALRGAILSGRCEIVFRSDAGEIACAVLAAGMRLNAKRIEKAARDRLRAVEQKVDILFQHSPNPILVLDARTMRIRFFNQKAFEAFGYTRAELTGMSFQSLLPGNATDSPEAILQRVSSGVSTFEELSLRRADGRIRQYDMAARFVTWEGKVAIIAELSEVSIQLEVREERNLLRRVVEECLEGIAILDSRGTILYANPSLGFLFNHPLQELIGRRLSALGSGTMGGDLLEEIQGVNSKGVPWKGSVEIVSAEGEKRHVQLMAYPLAKPASPSAERILIASDGTENLNLRRSLAQAQRMEALGHLAGGIAHDFNNILTIIQSATTYLAEHIPNKDPLQQEVAEILSASARAGELTRQLLTYSRRRSIEKSTSDLNEVIPPLARMLQRLIGENVELQLACSLGRLPVRLDPTQVQQILFNLASNARDAMPEGGILRITTRQEVLSAERARALKTTPGPQGVLEVADTGVGMTAELLDKVFAPYFTTKDEEKGTGIGLATVDAIVRQAGGAITVSSIPGQGTTFTVSMPLQKVPSSPRVRVFDLTPTEVSGLILLAEDEPAVRRLATSVLKQKGYDVVEAADGIEALEQASEIGGTFDILVTDVTMPRMSGLRLAAKLREDRPDLPVLFICGFSEDEAIRGGLQQGDLGYLQKPFTPNELAERVGRLLLEHRLMRPL